MADIFWLASYPKSGNTWIRILLSTYLRGGDQAIDISKRLEGGPIASARCWFDEWAGIEASALSDSLIERLRPEVYRCMAREEKNPIYMKTHDAWKKNDRNEALFPADITGGVVYILRNPLDLAASLANHYGVGIDQAVANLCNPSFANARSIGGMSDQLHQFLGSWSDHVRSWLDDSGLPTLTIQYEQLLDNTLETFSKLIRFLGLEWNEEKIKQTIEHCSFSALQRQERAHGFPERPRRATAFFRKGQSGGWREELNKSQVSQLVSKHKEVMTRFGYLDDRYEPM